MVAMVLVSHLKDPKVPTGFQRLGTWGLWYSDHHRLLQVPYRNTLAEQIALTWSYGGSQKYIDHCSLLFFIASLGLERDKFDNKTVSFEEHIKFEHNMWNYLYFIVLVRVKNKTDYTGPESYVAQMIKVCTVHCRIHAHMLPECSVWEGIFCKLFKKWVRAEVDYGSLLDHVVPAAAVIFLIWLARYLLWR